MSSLYDKSGIDMLKDSPYLVMFLSWLGDINWLFAASIAVAAFRGWIAYKEYKLKERVVDASNKSNAPTEEREDEERRR